MTPKFALLASKGVPLPIHGDGASMRSYLHVDDVAAAFALILLHGAHGEVYNIGTQKERSVLSVAREIAAYFNRDFPTSIVHVEDRAFNDQRYFICDKKLLRLGWTERVSWRLGLNETIKWYVMHNNDPIYWESGDIRCALAAHPSVKRHDILPDTEFGQCEQR